MPELDLTLISPDRLPNAVIDLERLVTGLTVAVPIYDFASHTRTGSRICQPASIIIVEGIFAFSHPLLLQRFNLKVWVEAADSTRYQRRLEREVALRGRDVIEVTLSSCSLLFEDWLFGNGFQIG